MEIEVVLKNKERIYTEMEEDELRMFKAAVQNNERIMVDIGNRTVRAGLIEQINIISSTKKNLPKIEEQQNDPQKLEKILAKIREDLKKRGIIKE